MNAPAGRLTAHARVAIVVGHVGTELVHDARGRCPLSAHRTRKQNARGCGSAGVRSFRYRIGSDRLDTGGDPIRSHGDASSRGLRYRLGDQSAQGTPKGRYPDHRPGSGREDAADSAGEPAALRLAIATDRRPGGRLWSRLERAGRHARGTDPPGVGLLCSLRFSPSNQRRSEGCRSW